MRSTPVPFPITTACVSFLAVLAGCDQPAGKVRSYFGSDALEVIAGAMEVEAYRIERELPQGVRVSSAQEPPQPPGAAADRRLGYYRILSGPVLLRGAWRRQLQGILFSAASSEWNLPKGCLPSPGVGVRYRRGDQEAHVYLCFECDLLHTGRLDSGKWKDFDPARPQLVRLVKEIFRGDPVIQALKERRR